MIDDGTFWLVTAGLAAGTFLIRFSFLGLLGNRDLPPLVLLHLKYVGVAVFPALILPLIVWPEATGGVPDPARLLAAGAALAVGLTGSVLGGIAAGMGTFYLLQAILP